MDSSLSFLKQMFSDDEELLDTSPFIADSDTTHPFYSTMNLETNEKSNHDEEVDESELETLKEKTWITKKDTEQNEEKQNEEKEEKEEEEEEDEDRLSMLDATLDMDMTLEDEDGLHRSTTVSDTESLDEDVAHGLRMVGLGLGTPSFTTHSETNPNEFTGLSLAELLKFEPQLSPSYFSDPPPSPSLLPSVSSPTTTPSVAPFSPLPPLPLPLVSNTSSSSSSSSSSSASSLSSSPLPPATSVSTSVPPHLALDMTELEKLFETEEEDIEQPSKSSFPPLPPPFSLNSLDSLPFTRPPLDEERKKELIQLFPEYSKECFMSFTTLFGPKAQSRLRPSILDLKVPFLSNKIENSALFDDFKITFENERSKSLVLTYPLIRSSSPSDESMAMDLDDVSSSEEKEELEEERSLVSPQGDFIEKTKHKNKNEQFNQWSFEKERSFMPVNLARWEEKVLWDAPSPSSISLPTPEAYPLEPSLEMLTKLPLRNIALDHSDWLSHSFFTSESLDTFQGQPNTSSSLFLTFPLDPPLSPPLEEVPFAMDRFNLSNDEYYKVLKGPKTTRDTTKLVLQHAPPAIRLATAYYKTELQPRELRSFHRPHLQAHPGLTIEFSRLRALKKKKIKGKDVAELLKRPRDITLKDTSNFTLLEYSEEHPILLSNKGMASFIFNYYRKKDKKDSFIPNLDLGAPNVLDPNASDPFWGYGDVEKGETLPVLVNNMISAPLFRHTAPETDFLIVRVQTKRATRWYLREVSNMYTVGQILPALEIAPPTSRIYTEYKRNRIRIAAFRLLKKRQEQAKRGVKFSELQNLFPHYAEVQLKSRLKEFMEGRGLQSGHWRLKGGATVPSEEEIRKMVTPEQVCMYETMCAAYRQLEDLDYAFHDTEGSRSPELALEEELAPWKITKNFSMAVAHKHFLKLEGLGDPTGCGEGFSFLRATHREKSGKWGTDTTRVSNQEQWVLYKAKIKEIWQRQLRSLSNPTPSIEPFEHQFKKSIPSTISSNAKGFTTTTTTTTTPQAKKTSPINSSFPGNKDFSHSSLVNYSRSTTPIPISGKYLSIKRRMKNSTEWQEEIVTDPKVILAYLKLKQQLENAGENSAIDKFRRQKLASETRIIRENQIQEVLRNSREVRCRRCGLMGHIKTNREKCPAWKPEDSPSKDSVTKKGKDTRLDDLTNDQELGNEEDENEEGNDGVNEHIEVEEEKGEVLNTSLPIKKSNSLASPSPKPVMKRRHSNLGLSEALDSILEDAFKTVPEAVDLLTLEFPQSKSDSNSSVSNSILPFISLQKIKDKNKLSSYSKTDEFLAEIHLLQSHVIEHHGTMHSLSQAVEKVASKVSSYIEEQSHILKTLEHGNNGEPSSKRHLSQLNFLEVDPSSSITSSSTNDVNPPSLSLHPESSSQQPDPSLSLQPLSINMSASSVVDPSLKEGKMMDLTFSSTSSPFSNDSASRQSMVKDLPISRSASPMVSGDLLDSPSMLQEEGGEEMIDVESI